MFCGDNPPDFLIRASSDLDGSNPLAEEAADCDNHNSEGDFLDWHLQYSTVKAVDMNVFCQLQDSCIVITRPLRDR